MNFFKSLLIDEEEESSSSSDLESDQNPSSDSNPDQKRSDLDDQQQEGEEEEEEEEEEESDTMGWNFGGLIKNIATKSESVLQTYRQDLSDFSSGLKIETSIIREVASRVVKELPNKFESGTSVATESLESVGQAIDDFGSSVWRGTAEIISQGKETLLSNSDFDENSEHNLQQFSSNNSMNSSSMNSKKYNRFEAQLYAIQTDLNTYSVNPEDLDDYEGWKSGFVLGEKSEEIESLLNENEVMEKVYTRIVPSEVDDGTFWYRYFYRVYKLKQIEDARANLVKRAIEGDEEEDLSWDVDDDDEEVQEEGNKLPVVNDDSVENKVLAENVSRAGNDAVSVADVGGNKDLVVESTSGNVSDGKGVVVIEGSSELNSDELVEGVDEKLVIQGKSEIGGESGKDSDFSVVSSQPSSPVDEEEDLSWDEIEDVGDSDEKKVSADGRASLAKRLTVADEDEDLSWDIEDEDDETVKS